MEPDSEFVLIKDVEESAYCRICLERGEPDQYMCLPCKCSGSIRYIHPDCLKEWIKESGSVECEICHSLYSSKWSMWAYENNLIRSTAPAAVPAEPAREEPAPEEMSSCKLLLISTVICLVFAFFVFLTAGKKYAGEEAAEMIMTVFRYFLAGTCILLIGLTVHVRRQFNLVSSAA